MVRDLRGHLTSYLLFTFSRRSALIDMDLERMKTDLILKIVLFGGVVSKEFILFFVKCRQQMHQNVRQFSSL